MIKILRVVPRVYGSTDIIAHPDAYAQQTALIASMFP